MTWWQRESTSARWKQIGTPKAAVIGRSGLAWGMKFASLARPGEPIKAEGDGRTPAGVHRLGQPFGFERPRDSKDFLVLKSSTMCVDDPNSVHYNTIVDASKVTVDWKSAEAMRSIGLYKFGFVVGYLSSAQTRAGSCIFVHIWRSPEEGTAGCLAAPETIVTQMQSWIDPQARPAIAFLTAQDLNRWEKCFFQASHGNDSH